MVAKIGPRSGPRNQKIADLRLVFVGRPGRRLQPRGREPSPETEGGLDSEIVFWCFLGLSFWTYVLVAVMVRFWIQLRQGCRKRAYFLAPRKEQIATVSGFGLLDAENGDS